MITIGIDRLNKKPVHISEVPRGRIAGAECGDCGAILDAKRGKRKAHHFSHRGNTDCLGESNLHRYAKELLAREKRLYLRHYPATIEPSRHRFRHAELEVTVGDFRIDCLLTNNDGVALAVEIKVTHAVEEAKRAMFRSKNLAAVEIDLSHLHTIDNAPSVDVIRREVCANPTNISWLFNAKQDAYARQRVEQILQETGVRLKIDNLC